MFRNIIEIFIYLYLIIFKHKVKSRFPTRLSPYFALRLDKNISISVENAFIGRDVRVNTGCCFYEDPIIVGNVLIGRYTSINGPATRISSYFNRIEIGSFCSIASNVIIQEDYHRYDKVTTYFMKDRFFKDESLDFIENCSKGDIIIKDDVWIGSNSVVLSGVTIGRGCIIGAGSIVSKSIPPYSIAFGSPAIVVKKRFDQDVIDSLEKLKWWEWDDAKIKRNKLFFMDKLTMKSFDNIF